MDACQGIQNLDTNYCRLLYLLCCCTGTITNTNINMVLQLRGYTTMFIWSLM